MRSESYKDGIALRLIQPILTSAKRLCEGLITTMHILIKAPRSLWLEKLRVVPKSAAPHHFSIEEAATFLSGNISLRERELAISHLAACGQCRKMIAEICHSEQEVKDVGGRSQ